MFLETSARTGENVEETFLKCARTILSKIESGLVHIMARASLETTYRAAEPREDGVRRAVRRRRNQAEGQRSPRGKRRQLQLLSVPAYKHECDGRVSADDISVPLL